MRSVGGPSQRALAASLFIVGIAGCDDSLGNIGPVALSATFSTVEDVPVTMTLMATDPDGDTLRFTLGSSPAHGTLSGSLPVVTYTPAPDYSGRDEITVSVTDGSLSAAARVGIMVLPAEDAPVAMDDEVAAAEDEVVTIAAGTLLANDVDVDGDVLAITDVGAATGGTVSLDGVVVTFTPDAELVGEASFPYTITDGSSTSTATVVVTFGGSNDAPLAVADTVATDEDTPVTITAADLLANDSDAELQLLTLTAVGAATSGEVDLVDGAVVYTPAPDVNGQGSFTYTISDGAKEASATVVVAIAAVNDAPVIANDAIATNEDAAVAVAIDMLLANDTDAEGDDLTVAAVTDPVNGTARVVGSEVRFTPAPNVSGTGSFKVTVTDGALSTTGVVTVAIANVPDAPVAADDTASIAEDTPLSIGGATLVANDSDADGDALSVTAVGGASHGTVALAGGRVTFTPAANYNGPASFSYTASDGGRTDTATVRLTVTPVNDAPVAGADDLTADNAVPEVVAAASLTGNDTDIDSSGLSVTAVAARSAEGGTVTLAGGSITYRAPADFIGDDRFNYTLSDGAASVTGVVRVSVGGVFASFESNDYTGWELHESSGDPSYGTFAVLHGTTTLADGMVQLDYHDMVVNTFVGDDFGPIGPTDGDHVAVHFQLAEESHTMTHPLRLPARARTLSWDMQYRNGEPTHDPQGQFIAVHILDANGSRLATVYKTTQGTHPLAIPMTSFEVDVRAYAGRSIKIQVQLEVQRGYFPAAFDNFRID